MTIAKIMNTYNEMIKIYSVSAEITNGTTVRTFSRSGKNYAEVKAEVMNMIDTDVVEEEYKINNYGVWEKVKNF